MCKVYAKCMNNFHMKGEEITIRYDNMTSQFEIDNHVEDEDEDEVTKAIDGCHMPLKLRFGNMN